MRNKSGQLSDTITWIVATIIIVVILLIFIYASSLIAGVKEIERGSKVLIFGEGDKGDINWIDMKTSFAYAIDSQSKSDIDKWILENEKYDKK